MLFACMLAQSLCALADTCTLAHSKSLSAYLQNLDMLFLTLNNGAIISKMTIANYSTSFCMIRFKYSSPPNFVIEKGNSYIYICNEVRYKNKIK